ncbi:MAG: FMN-binding protein [Rhizobacter sp.]
MRMVLAAVGLVAPTAAFAVDYLSAEQARKLMFPEADSFEQREINLDATQLQALGSNGTPARSVHWVVQVAKHADNVLGYVVVDEVIGKFELITYAVGLNVDGGVRQLEVLSYRESHGHEVRLPAWRRQFIGKTSASPLRVGEDIANISGATLSCTHVTDGVRRIVAVLGLARRSGALS